MIQTGHRHILPRPANIGAGTRVLARERCTDDKEHDEMTTMTATKRDVLLEALAGRVEACDPTARLEVTNAMTGRPLGTVPHCTGDDVRPREPQPSPPFGNSTDPRGPAVRMR
jgi:hypothetical protein